MTEIPAKKQFVADFSLALINRTGAYYVCREILEALPEHFLGTRYWRHFLKQEPNGLNRKVLGRTMLLEFDYQQWTRWLPDRHRRWDAPTLFLDPLYVLGTSLGSRDIVLCHDVGPVSEPHLFDKKTAS